MSTNDMPNPYYTSRVPPGHGRPTVDVTTNKDLEFLHSRPELFTPDECARIVELGNQGPRFPYFAQYSADGDAGSIDVANENHEAHEILYADGTDWLYQRVREFVTDVNRDVFHLKTTDEFSTALILRTYHPGSSVKWHFDNLQGGEKIGIVIQLTDENAYEGGELGCAIGVGEGFQVAPRTQGTGLLFPTYVCHSVLPIKSGTRHTLVGWMMGDVFV